MSCIALLFRRAIKRITYWKLVFIQSFLFNDSWNKNGLTKDNDAPRKKSKGDAENARHEIAGHENAAPECRGGKCET